MLWHDATDDPVRVLRKLRYNLRSKLRRLVPWLDQDRLLLTRVRVGAYAGVGLAVAYVAGWGPQRLLIVPNSLAIATYVIGTAAGVRLLGGGYRWLAGLSLALCLMILPFARAAVVLPAAVAAAVWLYRRALRTARTG